MEKLESGCVVLKNKEYKELVEKANDNEPKEIAIKYTYQRRFGYSETFMGFKDYRFGYYKFSDNFLDVNGNIDMSGKIKSQLYTIFKSIDTKYDALLAESVKIVNEANKESIQMLINTFSTLPWYKRLFFNKSYIK